MEQKNNIEIQYGGFHSLRTLFHFFQQQHHDYIQYANNDYGTDEEMTALTAENEIVMKSLIVVKSLNNDFITISFFFCCFFQQQHHDYTVRERLWN
jgi:hypothetical protein